MQSRTVADRPSAGHRASARPHYGEAIIVRVNRIIADLVPGYLEARRNELVDIWERISNGDLESLRVIGHKLKGSGEGYGFREITLLGAQIEDAAAAGEMHVVREAAARLEEYVSVVSFVTDDE